MGLSGLLGQVVRGLFGGPRNVVAETAEVFRVNAEANSARSAEIQSAALAQMASEFRLGRRSWFDRLIDGLNRVPRPAMALGTVALFVSAMVDPLWFEARMVGIQAVPEPLWWLLGAIVSFYFGARFQAKGQEFRRDVQAGVALMPQIVDQIREIEAARRELRAPAPLAATDPTSAAPAPAPVTQIPDPSPVAPVAPAAPRPTSDNPALDAWRAAG